MEELTPVGWREWIGLPDLGVDRIKAKVDTGARSSAIHAWGIRRFERDGETWVKFRLHPIQKDDRTVVECEAPLIDERKVKSSTGTVTLRPVVTTTLEWSGRRWEIELTLVRRDAMGFRMLIGREAMKGRWMVDPARSYAGGRRRKRSAAKGSRSKGETST